MDKLALLRRVVKNLDIEPLKEGPITQEQLERSPFARARFGPRGYIGILKAGGEALSDLTDALFRGALFYERGSTFDEVLEALFDVMIQHFLDREASGITAADLIFVEHAIEAWFNDNSSSFHFYVPCIVTPRPAPAFVVGPVRFSYVEDFTAHERKGKAEAFELNFGAMLQDMAYQRAFWVAEVDVDRSMPKRARELGELAVDLSIAALQIVIHPQHSRHMARLSARAVPRYRHDVSTTGATISPSVANQEPGLLLGPGTFELYVTEAGLLLGAVGAQVNAFLSRSGGLPTLSRAWTDAAYWYHEGLAESLDTIAVPKLETAIEVLLRSEKSSGSEARLCRAVQVFYGLKAGDFINPNSTITVKQFAKQFVRDRSMILHGTLSTLSTSMRASRTSLEGLVVGLLARYVFLLSAYEASSGASDNLDAFLTFADIHQHAPSQKKGLA